jgi:hypothetical protein
MSRPASPAQTLAPQCSGIASVQEARRPDSALAPSAVEGKGGLIGMGGHVAPIPLRALLAELPPDGVVPIRWVRERLEAEAAYDRTAVLVTESGVGPPQPGAGSSERMGPVSADLRDWLSAQEFGARRYPARSAEWVRDACRAGEIPGAQKEGAMWLIPSTALQTAISRAPRFVKTAAERPQRSDRSANRDPKPRGRSTTGSAPVTYPRWGGDPAP